MQHKCTHWLRAASRRHSSGMTPTPLLPHRVALVGGDGRFPLLPGARCFPSRRDGGLRGIRDVVRCVKQRTVDHVVLLVRWLGHTDVETVKRACRAHGVQCVVVPGGGSMAAARLREWLP